jgi:hypothetical protein
MTFGKLPVGARFKLNGNTYHKASTRTARLLSFKRVFYVGQNEQVELVK